MPRWSTTGLTVTELLASVMLAVSGCVFVSLVTANFLVFSSSKSVQNVGSYLLAPVYFFTVRVLGLSPFDEGLWAFSAFCVMLLSISMLRARRSGLANAMINSLTLIGPAVLVFFEVGVYFLIPSYFYAQATNFVGRAGLGGLISNFTVLVVSSVILSGRLLLGALRIRYGKERRLEP